MNDLYYKSGRYSFFKYLLEFKVCLTTNYSHNFALIKTAQIT